MLLLWKNAKSPDACKCILSGLFKLMLVGQSPIRTNISRQARNYAVFHRSVCLNPHEFYSNLEDLKTLKSGLVSEPADYKWLKYGIYANVSAFGAAPQGFDFLLALLHFSVLSFTRRSVVV